MLRRPAMLLSVIAIIAAFGLAGCGSSSSSSSSGSSAGAAVGSTATGTTSAASTTSFAKTKFILHVGLAGGAFHRWIYKPFKAGAFSKPLSHKLAIVKAALSSLFIYHELKLAATDAKSSKILSTLVAPITAAVAAMSALRSKLVKGKFDGAEIDQVQQLGGQVVSEASSKGIQIPDIPVNSPTGAGAPTG
jgi:hypothetical protein